ncbi:hypothetical protein [Mesorhizobium sp. ANAO-SY3R2]|uniref:hypothetical protein n=1 Tax=Mesorhizobium sp. ANAO-SY3R2 TaxID=3166644 RepID=UPI003671196D
MADARKARPVSGEIMAGPGRDTSAQSLRPDPADVIDADFEVVALSRPRGESTDGHNLHSRHKPTAGGMDMLRAITPQRPSVAMRGGPIFWFAGISLAAMVFWTSGGHAIVRAAAFPRAWQASSLRLADITSRVDASGHRSVLIVDGAAVNDGDVAAELRPIDIFVASDDGKTMRYRLGTATSQVAPGARWAFSSRLEVPMNGIKTVKVVFSE